MNKIISSIAIMIFLLGCESVPKITKQEAFPKMYENSPASILVVPAINKTTAANAGEFYATTIARPLSEAGFYVFSIPYVTQFLHREGIVDGEQIVNVPMDKFKEVFDADAVLFVTITGWDTNYYVAGGDVTVAAKFELKSTESSETLWKYNAKVIYNTSGNSGNIIADIISTAITTAMIDYVPIAQSVNQQIISTVPVGHYHARFGKDGMDTGIEKKRTIN